MDRECSMSYIRGNGEMDVPFTTIPDMISRHAETKGIAQIFINWRNEERETITFAEILVNATKFAKGLVHLGIKRGDIVAIGTETCPEWMIASVGTQMCGASTLLFNFNVKDGSDLMDILRNLNDKCKAVIFPPGQNDMNVSILQYIFEICTTKGQVTCASLPNLKLLIAMFKDQQNIYLTLRDVMIMGHSEIRLPTIYPEDDAVILMTSGSTGTPKLIPLTHLSLLFTGHNFEHIFGKESKKTFNDRPFNWIAGYPTWEILTGGTRVAIKNLSSIPSITDYNKVVNNILHEEECDASYVLPSTLLEMMTDKNQSWKFKSLVSGSQPSPASLTNEMSQVCERFGIVYGCTEIGIISFQTFDRNKSHIDYEVGFPVAGMEVKVVNDKGNVVMKEENGEVLVRAPLAFAGYLGNDIQTSQAFTKQGWFKTGDSGRITKDGCLIVEGRISDSLVKVGAILQSVVSMESKLKQHESIHDATVITCRDPNEFQIVCCAVVLKPGCKVTMNEMEDFLLNSNNTTASLLQQMQVPKNYLFFDQFPKTYNGKINRKEVANICRERIFQHKTDL